MCAPPRARACPTAGRRPTPPPPPAQATIKDEEESFGRTLVRGIREFNRIVADVKGKRSAVIPGEAVFFLKDTLGFPEDLTELMAKEAGLNIDKDGFNTCQEAARELARSAARAAAKAAGRALVLEAEQTVHLSKTAGVSVTDDSHKYLWHASVEARVLAIFAGEPGFVESARAETGTVRGRARCFEPRRWGLISTIFCCDGVVVVCSGGCGGGRSRPVCTQVGVILDKSPFYAESGGQVCDVGMITVHAGESKAAEFTVTNVQVFAGYVLHIGHMSEGAVAVGAGVTAHVDYKRRGDVAPNHTMTHMLNFALRAVLGTEVEQKGSLVTEEKLRFDFNNNKGLTMEEVRAAPRAAVGAHGGVAAPVAGRARGEHRAREHQ